MWTVRHQPLQPLSSSASRDTTTAYPTPNHSSNIMQLAAKAVSLCGADVTPGSGIVPEHRAAELERTLSSITRECCKALAETTSGAGQQQQRPQLGGASSTQAFYANPASALLFLKQHQPSSALQQQQQNSTTQLPEPYLLPPPALHQNMQPISHFLPRVTPPSQNGIDLRWGTLAAPTTPLPDRTGNAHGQAPIADHRQLAALPSFPPTVVGSNPESGFVSGADRQQFVSNKTCRSMSLDTGRVTPSSDDHGHYRPASWSEAVDMVRRKGVKARKSCSECGTMQTCQWRRGPNGTVSLCNACGIRYRRARNRNRPLVYEEDGAGQHEDMDTSAGGYDGTQGDNAREEVSTMIKLSDFKDRRDTGAIVHSIVDHAHRPREEQQQGIDGGDDKMEEQRTDTKRKRSNIYLLLN